MSEQPYDSHKVLKELREIPGQYHETDVEVDPNAGISGVHRYIGTSGTIGCPTREGPTMIFNNIKRFPSVRVDIGTMANHKCAGHILHHDYRDLGHLLNKAVEDPVKPVKVSKDQTPAQEAAHLATDDNFNIRKPIAAPINTEYDAGPYITTGSAYGSTPDKSMSDIAIHRMVLGDKDTTGIYIMPGGRYIGAFLSKYQEPSKPAPIIINIDLDPAILIGAIFEPSTTPLGYSESWVAGTFCNEPVQLVDPIAVDEVGIACSKFIIEGEILPNETIREDINTHTGHAMSEFPGHDGPASPALDVIKVKTVVYCEDNPIMQITTGSSEEHMSVAGIPIEVSILNLVDKAISGEVLNVYNPPAGGGKLMAIMQIRKENPTDEGIQCQAALLTFSSFKELRTVISVDGDVGVFDIDDVMQAINTRFQAHEDIMSLEDMRNHPLDPSERPEYSPEHIRVRGMSSRLALDGTVPFDMKDQFGRARFREVPDWERILRLTVNSF